MRKIGISNERKRYSKSRNTLHEVILRGEQSIDRKRQENILQNRRYLSILLLKLKYEIKATGKIGKLASQED